MKNFIKNYINKIKDSNINIAGFFICPLILLISLMIMHRMFELSCLSFYNTGNVLFKIGVSYIFLLAVEAGLLAIIQKISIVNLIMNIFFYTMAFANENMCMMTGDPILPTDFLLIGSLGTIASFVEMKILLSHIISLFICLFSIILFFFMDFMKRKNHKKLKISLKTRVILSLIGIIFSIFTMHKLCIDNRFRNHTMAKNGVYISAFNPKADYFSNGLILTFFPRIGNSIIDTPKGYSKEKIAEIKSEYLPEDIPVFSDTAGKEKIKPNIIVVQSEALWNPTLLPNASFTSDPLINTKKLMAEGTGGVLVTPSFGGGTCLAEFEFLTGFSTRLLPAGFYPHIQSFTKPTPTLASICRDNGYETVAYHPYHRNFYSRNKAFPFMGFDEFISIENLEDPEYDGHYISDDQMVKDLIKAYEEKSKDRILLYAISMQNHGDYNTPRYPGFDVLIDCDELSERDLSGLLDYTQGVFDADKAFNTLCEYFRNVKEPTLIVTFGDHLPLLGIDGSTYQDGGFIPKHSTFNYSQYEEMFRTPIAVWANYDISSFTLPSIASAGNLGTKVMQMANLENIPWYYEILDEFYSKYPVFTGTAMHNSENYPIENVYEKDKKLLKKISLIQHDILHAKQYSNK